MSSNPYRRDGRCRPIALWFLSDRMHADTLLVARLLNADDNEAVGVVIATLSDDEMAKIAALARDQLAGLHFGLGAWIRNNLGWWKGNDW